MNSLILSGARAYYAMSLDGLFFKKASSLNRANVPSAALVMQGMVGSPGIGPDLPAGDENLWQSLQQPLGLHHLCGAHLLYFDNCGVFRLRKLRPNAERPYRASGILLFRHFTSSAQA